MIIFTIKGGVFKAGRDDQSTQDLLKEAMAEGMSLKKIDLEYLNVRGVDFSNQDLRGSNIMHADLRGCKFTNTNVRGLSTFGTVLDKGAFDDAIKDSKVPMPKLEKAYAYALKPEQSKTYE